MMPGTPPRTSTPIPYDLFMIYLRDACRADNRHTSWYWGCLQRYLAYWVAKYG